MTVINLIDNVALDMERMTMGSLFDGSGGFPLAGSLHGIEPVWASEIEAYPMRVTALRFPNMKQLGDVTKINGAEIEPVDIITFGSPCQDLSVAGLQKGIHEGERSNLFFEAVRIVKEMRHATTGKFPRPRFAVWENVPGAFSSNRGEDFRAVLQAFCDLWDEPVRVPAPPKGKWTHAGCVVGDGQSLAWRLYDAQFWGVPQRRKRIYLIADFGSGRAGEVLFERESVRGNPAQGGEAREGVASDAEGSAGGSNQDRRSTGLTGAFMGGQGAKARSIAYCDDGTTPTLKSAPSGGNTVPDVVYPADTALCLKARHDGSPCPERGQGQNVVVISIQGNCIDRADTARCNVKGYKSDGTSYTLDIIDRHAVCYPINTMVATRTNEENRTTFGVGEDGDPQFTLSAAHEHAVCYAIDQHQQDARFRLAGDVVPTLSAKMGQGGNNTPMVLQENSSGNGVAATLDASYWKGPGARNGNEREYIVQKTERRYIVRRLTPLECCRLQGFPDWWEDGADGSDSARYKMWGNGIALPCAADVMGRISKELRK